MTMRATLRSLALGTVVFGTALLVDIALQGGLSIEDAQARIGRPATPGSVAGVARRTTRRTIRRTTIYRASLPRGCTTVLVSGTSLHQCGGTYYQPHGNQYVVVNVD